jgi:hypothetical protein
MPAMTNPMPVRTPFYHHPVWQPPPQGIGWHGHGHGNHPHAMGPPTPHGTAFATNAARNNSPHNMPSMPPYSSVYPANMEYSRIRLAEPHSMVTPTPSKKPRKETPSKDSSYSRKTKSLGMLAQTFLNRFRSYPRNTLVIVDEIAKELGVERRRIYDVVNILESVRLVTKKGKNTYHWMGMDHLDYMFALVQREGFQSFPYEAVKTGLLRGTPTDQARESGYRQLRKENRSLAKLSSQFLQIFLVGNAILSLPDAADKIFGTSDPTETAILAAKFLPKSTDAADPKARLLAETRGAKTKIRRLYDIANVFMAVGILGKHEHSTSHCRPKTPKRPMYRWTYHLNAVQIAKVFATMPCSLKEYDTPFLPSHSGSTSHDGTSRDSPVSATSGDRKISPSPELSSTRSIAASTPALPTKSDTTPSTYKQGVLDQIHVTGGACDHGDHVPDGELEPRRVSLP